jgi:hypothetical protein
VPAVESENDTNPIEVGLKFQSDVTGYVTAIRFYKGPANTGTHVGSLWASDGTFLASATFTDESTTGWQKVDFASPVAISANTTYVASYHTEVGGYSVDQFYFTAPRDSGPLHALADGQNGVYRYGEGAFPYSSWQMGNYWVDVEFSATTVVASQTPTATPGPGDEHRVWIPVMTLDRPH